MITKGPREYFSDFWNIADTISFIVYVYFYSVRIFHSHDSTIMYLMKDFKTEKDSIEITETDKLLVILNCVILTMSLAKLLEFMRASEKTQLMTVLVSKVT